MFFKNRTECPTPISFVKFKSRATLLINGCSNSMPIKDHVPELKYAQFPPVAGTAATAAAVSCEHDATTCAPTKSVCPAMSSRNGPNTVPEGTNGGNCSTESPAALNNAPDQSRRTGL